MLTKRYNEKMELNLNADITDDIRTLSLLTNRTVNELADIALATLLADNKFYFIETMVWEHFNQQLSQGVVEFIPFEMGGLRVEMRYVDDSSVEVTAVITSAGKVIDSYTQIFSDVSEELERHLKNLYIYIKRDAEDVRNYLNRRTSYQ